MKFIPYLAYSQEVMCQNFGLDRDSFSWSPLLLLQLLFSTAIAIDGGSGAENSSIKTELKWLTLAAQLQSSHPAR